MTNFERITASPEELAMYTMCPYSKDEPDEVYESKSCIQCSLDWLCSEAKE